MGAKFLIWSAPITARYVLCPSAIGDEEILTLQRVGGGRVRAKDFRSSFRTVKTYLSLSKLTRRKKERKKKKTTVIVLLAVVHYVLLFKCIRLMVLHWDCVCVCVYMYVCIYSLGPDVVRSTTQPVFRNCIPTIKHLNSITIPNSGARLNVTGPLFIILYSNYVW
jgi:hypothetical protein